MNTLVDTAPAFVEMAHRIVWCSAATVDSHGRPRSRILHPIWQWDGQNLVGWIVTSPTGSAAFNEELGRLTLLSYPMIALPATLMMMAILYYIWRTVHDMTGLTMEELLVTENNK